jgi:uncharacterized protein YfaS (alpha-2-macroglobulin family)
MNTMRIILLLLFLLTTTICRAQTYEPLWKEVQTFESGGQPRSALDLVLKIHAQAIKDGNGPQLVKALVHEVKFNAQFEEESLALSIARLKEEAKTLPAPTRQIVHSIIGEMYWAYWNNNNWQIRQRTATAGMEGGLLTWDLKRIAQEADLHFTQSLQGADTLCNAKLETYTAILQGDARYRKLRPTLYHLLLSRAMDFYGSEDRDLVNFDLSGIYDHAALLADADAFLAWKAPANDGLQPAIRAVQLYQDLLREAKKVGTDALVVEDLRRLDFMHRRSQRDGKDAQYEKALRELYPLAVNKALAAEVTYPIAQLYYTQGSGQFAPNDALKWKWKQAYRLCADAVNGLTGADAESIGAQQCRSLMATISQREWSMQAEGAVIPNKPFRFLLNYRNVGEAESATWPAFVQVAKLDPLEYRASARQNYGEKIVQWLQKHSTSVASKQFALPNGGDFRPHSIELPLDGLPIGTYVIFVGTDESLSTSKQAVAFAVITVSDLTLVKRQQVDGTTLLQVLSRDGGKPVAGAQLELLQLVYDRKARTNDYQLSTTLRTDVHGEATWKTEGGNYQGFIVDVHTDTDHLITADNLYAQHREEDVRWNNETQFFLDRAIYRPGQTIHFKGISLRSNGKDVERIANANTTVRLFDANGQETASLDLRTNTFGTFSGTFIAPTSGLNGFISIGNEHGSHSFRMEEYKRPKFEVSLDAPKEQFRVGNTVAVIGLAKSYAGVPLAGAEVKYRVTRSARFPYPWRCWGWFPQSNPKQVAYGTATTDASGAFTVRFEAQPDPLLRPTYFPVFSYAIEADVTDLSGEMQTGSSSVSIGFHALDLNIGLPEIMDKEEVKSAIISSTNLSGEKQATDVSVTVWRLKANERILRNRPWEKPDTMLLTEAEHWKLFPNDPYRNESDPATWQKGEKLLETRLNTGKDGQLDLSALKTKAVGRYLVELTATDAFGKEVKQQQQFLLMDKKATTPALATTAWFHPLKAAYQPGEQLELLIATSYTDVRFRVEVEVKEKGYSTNKLIFSEVITMSNAQRLLSIPVTEEWRGNAEVHITAVRNNELLSWTHLVNVPFTNKELDVKLETFRKEMSPDDAEEWTLRITDRKGNAVKAELLATMYDASLDVLAPNAWDLQPYRFLNARFHWGSSSFGMAQAQNWEHDDWDVKFPGGATRDFERLNWYGLYLGRGDIMLNEVSAVTRSRGQGKMMKSQMVMDMAESAAPAASGMAMDEDDYARESSNAEEPKSPEVKMRSDFSETVFFHPHLLTDDAGRATIAFKAPQSLTRWKFMGLATTTDLSIGTITEQVVTRKQLMITPNYPRFVREGDKLIFQVKVDVLDSMVSAATASLEVKDALTGEILPLKIENRKLKIENGGAVARWELSIPEGLAALTFTTKAWSEKHSDGEEKTIPVLANRMLVTEAMPLPVRGKGTHNFTFEKLKNSTSTTLRHQSLTLEFTPNPVWLAVLSLPYMMEYPYECSEQLFSRYYANAIGVHLANSDPAIKRMFDQWKRAAQQKEGDAFLSQLEKNPEMKQALLTETPWVRDAQDETEQRRRIAELFDTERMEAELLTTIKKLKQNQQADGGWGWFNGLRSDLYITRHIVAGFGKLRTMGVWQMDADTRDMLAKAVKFMDEEVVEYHKNTIKEKNRVPDWFELHSAYARSFWLKDFATGMAADKAYSDILSRIKLHWTKFDAAQKGLAAVILHRNGMTKDAKQMLVSLRETSTKSMEFGTYWAMDKGYYWHQAPIENHVMILEAFHEVEKDTAMVAEMNIWLLKQKQTQRWETTKATAEACYALLSTGGADFNTQPMVSITLGNETIDPRKDPDMKTEAGTGYFKTNWTGKAITPEMGNMTVTKENKGVAWGAVYWQYFEDLDKITGAQDNPIKMQREVMLREDTPNGPVLRPLDAKTVLKVGDRVQVRIVLTTDRHMEYVHLKDMRAASFEPREQLSGAAYQEGVGYYRSTTDAAMNFFFGYLPKGTFVFEYGLNVTQAGEFSNGISQLQCMYAPEFTTHSEGLRMRVE